MRSLRRSHLSRRAVSLVVTLLCIIVLTIIVLAFLQSMSLERKTARSYANLLRAQLAADSAQAEAVARLSEAMAANPYHAIGYTNLDSGMGSQLFTILFGAASATNVPTNFFLCSTTSALTNYTALANVPAAMNATNSTAINRKAFAKDKAGWMGSPLATNSTDLTYRECRATWVYIARDPSASHDPNPSSATYNPYVARYAWWVEDETSKVDITLAGNNEGTAGAFRPAQATNLVTPTSTSYLDAAILRPGQIDLGAVPIYNGSPIATNNGLLNNQYISFRTNVTNLPRDGRILAQAPGGVESEKTSRFYTTMASVANDLAGNGMRRVNLNALVHDESSSPTIIASDVDDIAFAITGKHLFPEAQRNGGVFYSNAEDLTNALIPDFGARFYPGNSSLTHKDIYVTKVAANIRDYIDADSMPTFIDYEGKVFAGQSPPLPGVTTAFPMNLRSNGSPRAIGKEALPYFHKHAYSFYVTKWEGSTATFFVDQSFGFYNPSTKDFIAPQGTFLRVFNRMGWATGGFGAGVQMLDFEFDLSGIRFPAGRATAITTAPVGATTYGIFPDAGRVERPPFKALVPTGNPNLEEGVRAFTDRTTSSGKFNLITRTGDVHDYHTYMVWGNTSGYYDGFGSITITHASDYCAISGLNTPAYPNQFSFTSLYGNKGPSRTGDPRSTSEYMEVYDTYITGADTTGNHDQTRFYWTDPGTGEPTGPSALTRAYNIYVSPGIDHGGASDPWPDYHQNFNSQIEFDDTVNTAYAVIRDEPMTSIGELGNIYDPHRKPAAVSPSIARTRGGGRTLRVGQPDDVAGGTGAPRFTAAWRTGAWRLLDVFDVVIETSGTSPVNRTNPVAQAQSRGKINVNSVLRDQGVALKTLARRMDLLPRPFGDDNVTPNRTLTDAELTALISDIKTYLVSKGPMMDRGELSQVSFFDANGTTRTTGGRQYYAMLDRGREEVIRRIVPFLTTRSGSFSVYAVGQAVKEDSSGKILPLAESLKSKVYRFDPVIGGDVRDRATNFSIAPLYECL